MQTRQGFVTELEIETIWELLADLICCRCKFRYRDHANADHLFFNNAEDAGFEEFN
jgi:hypothetical protein